jgi:crotonobetainyl-CoA:carnitine CoA-transferase CaiB-like acyl-CoA transferase
VRQRFSEMTKADLMAACERAGLPYAPITKPEDLFDDPHLNGSGGFTGIRLADGRATKVPTLPFEMDGRRFEARLDPPAPGSHAAALLAELGYDDAAVRKLGAAGVVVLPGQ